MKFPDGSMRWDETKADPNPGGGSVIDAGSGAVVPGANRQSGSTGPGGNGVAGSQANPLGTYTAGPKAPSGGGYTPPVPAAGMAPMSTVGNATPPATTPTPVKPGTAAGAFPGADAILGGYQFDPDDPAKAFRNALRQLGVPTAFLAGGSNSAMGKYLMNRSSGAYYQFLTDQAMNGGQLNSDAYAPYLSNFLQRGLNPGTDMGGRLGYLNQLQGRLPTDVGNFKSSDFGGPAEAALASILMTQSPQDLTDLLLGQYSGAVSPGLIGSAMRPLAQNQAQSWEDTGRALTGGNLFSSLKNFFLGR